VRALLAAVALALIALPAQARPPLVLHPCFVGSGKARCGTMRVPENRAHPERGWISLRVVVLPATGKPVARDPVVWLAGGPGGAATADAGPLRSLLGAANVHRDIVLVDQRGTGGSRRLACPPVRPDVVDADTFATYLQACQTALGADFTRYGTVDAVDDVYAVVTALGYRKIDLWGGSYGATAAQVYLNRHPGSLRTLVLDSGTLLSVPIFERWGSNGQRALDQIAARCAAQKACAAAFPTWKADLPTLLARLSVTPVQVDVAGAPVTLDGDGVAGTVQAMSRSAESAEEIPYAVAHAVRGDYQPLARAVLALARGSDERLVMFYSITCNEPWAAWDPARSAADAAGTYLAESYAHAGELNSLVCSRFPHRDESPADWRNPRSNVPTLVLVGGADPQDPIGNIAAIRQAMPRARVLVAPGLGHGVGYDPCVNRLATRFLERGTSTGLATGCLHLITTPTFRVD
jgi:pimeloyl-ACP methyl ester carboxylesterase